MLDILQIEEIGIKTLLPNLIAKTLLGETVSCLVEDDLILVNRKGGKIVGDLSASPIMNDDEKIVGSIFTVRDISSRKQAEIGLSDIRQVLQNSLAPREKEVLHMMVKGSSTKEIAFDLNINTRTVGSPQAKNDGKTKRSKYDHTSELLRNPQVGNYGLDMIKKL